MPPFFSRALSLAMVALLAACDSGPTEPDPMDTEVLSLRIANDTAEPITVEIIAAESVPAADKKNVDFGTIQPEEVTTYQAVSDAFTVLVNGAPFPDDDQLFGVSDPPSPRWTLRIQSSGGWSQNADFD